MPMTRPVKSYWLFVFLGAITGLFLLAVFNRPSLPEIDPFVPEAEGNPVRYRTLPVILAPNPDPTPLVGNPPRREAPIEEAAPGS
jgi:hypothetical protein